MDIARAKHRVVYSRTELLTTLYVLPWLNNSRGNGLGKAQAQPKAYDE